LVEYGDDPIYESVNPNVSDYELQRQIMVSFTGNGGGDDDDKDLGDEKERAESLQIIEEMEEGKNETDIPDITPRIVDLN
jgi:hypothetical protein